MVHFWNFSMTRFFLVLLLCLSVSSVLANNQNITVAAKSYSLIDFQTGQMLAGHNIHERIEPASLTKLMTAYVIFSALKQNRLTLNQVIPVSQTAWKMIGSRMFI